MSNHTSKNLFLYSHHTINPSLICQKLRQTQATAHCTHTQHAGPRYTKLLTRQVNKPTPESRLISHPHTLHFLPIQPSHSPPPLKIKFISYFHSPFMIYSWTKYLFTPRRRRPSSTLTPWHSRSYSVLSPFSLSTSVTQTRKHAHATARAHTHTSTLRPAFAATSSEAGHCPPRNALVQRASLSQARSPQAPSLSFPCTYTRERKLPVAVSLAPSWLSVIL